ncbi:hypothetical protein L2E82_47731 [Cichorium intybus]|uniref:Uncharacterized protein n=1 Tax=Cichorium intybus TaxID=13427 RepID=A0ACB8YWK9_CICIN|nr:hypothetical protein L2E82_47731 [Cichorium intybus]
MTLYGYMSLAWLSLSYNSNHFAYMLVGVCWLVEREPPKMACGKRTTKEVNDIDSRRDVTLAIRAELE